MLVFKKSQDFLFVCLVLLQCFLKNSSGLYLKLKAVLARSLTHAVDHCENRILDPASLSYILKFEN